MPSVSLVVPVFNAEETIGDCLDSLLAQTYPKELFELIVVDNDSTDGTANVLRAYRGEIRVLHEHERGAAAARNVGIANARGEVVAFTDADCRADADWLRNIVEPLDDPSVGIVGGEILAAEPCNRVARFGIEINDNRKSIEVFSPPYVITMNCCARLAVLKRLHSFDARFRRGQDVELSYRAVQAGYRLVFRPEAIIYHRHPHTLRGLFWKGFQHGFASVQVLKKHDGFLAALRQRRRVNGKAYLAIGAQLINAARGVEPSKSLCDAVFNSGKKLGKACGSLRFRYLDL
jgi:glycosyltransferase involved in cell wall biosynthesis